MKKLAFLIIALLFLLGNIYIGRKLLLILEHFYFFNHPFILWGVISLFSITSIATLLLFDMNVGGVVGKMGSYWLSFWFVSLVIFGLTELILKVTRKITTIQSNNELVVWITAAVLIVILVCYGSWHAQQIKTMNYQVTIDRPGNDRQKKLKAVLISDVHLGYVNDVKKLEKIVTKINQMNPAIIFISGDLFDGNFKALQDTEGMKKQFRRLSSTYGTYMCWGNHDAGETFDQMKELVESSNITLLEDEMTVVGEEILVVGRKDSRPIGSQAGDRKSIQEQFEKVGNQLPKIILDHQPSNIDEYKHSNELILSGHTHQGQIFPFSLVTKAYFTVDYGYYRKDKNSPQVIVSSGVGTWGPPMRIGTQSEIVQIDITIK
ncbi:metallophosphoesterase [Candidatus Enterococcus ikei]|uniref:Metallophosphoesterase n=1 Tax=Candidatus Enterococcus ikei TaxID=2815326 RepID=A0ABS3H2M8_9ENTE|nr:metallophosphoesterase [Enterococcus sp. DIV0869a]MBO0441780.1 metallophosphoesterase [Enterococcus sp. DIV0869a]